MAVYGCAISSGPMFQYYTASKPVLDNLARPYIGGLHSSFPLKKTRLSYLNVQKFISLPKGPTSSSYLNLSATSTSLFSTGKDRLSAITPLLPKKKRLVTVPKATQGFPFNFRYPVMTNKPRWWWRFLAAIPYLMPLHETWLYAETAYHVMPFLESFEFMTMPFFEGVSRVPAWAFYVYFLSAYLLIVRRKEWPHFLRFHIIMGMLMEIGFQAIGQLWKAAPKGLYWGKIGAHFWTAFALAHLATCLQCMYCALVGMYADVPLISAAAYIQMPYD